MSVFKYNYRISKGTQVIKGLILIVNFLFIGMQSVLAQELETIILQGSSVESIESPLTESLLLLDVPDTFGRTSDESLPQDEKLVDESLVTSVDAVMTKEQEKQLKNLEKQRLC